MDFSDRGLLLQAPTEAKGSGPLPPSISYWSPPELNLIKVNIGVDIVDMKTEVGSVIAASEWDASSSGWATIGSFTITASSGSLSKDSSNSSNDSLSSESNSSSIDDSSNASAEARLGIG
ncbi:hypothetical protein ACH5RR_018207 [Cinchona calisaya]|uniref:Uncharacterized protein n=1 Tax=Cinchona calisaya TaxID=153742 RepID=A0ABD2ZM33_9GENT